MCERKDIKSYILIPISIAADTPLTFLKAAIACLGLTFLFSHLLSTRLLLFTVAVSTQMKLLLSRVAVDMEKWLAYSSLHKS